MLEALDSIPSTKKKEKGKLDSLSKHHMENPERMRQCY
jgi:hypothetical protein